MLDMASNEWHEVTKALTEKRHELTLCGTEINSRLEEGNLDGRIFQIKELNFLEISNSVLAELSNEIGNLTCLKDLALQGNKLKELPNTISELKALTFFDLSNNELETIPASISECASLYRLNLTGNKLESLPSVTGLQHLSVLHLDNNALTCLPDGLFELSHVSEIYASKNQISEVGGEIGNLKSLKILDLSENCIKEIPSELADCVKLKDLNLQNNPLKDNRLKKMALQCGTKAIMTYIAQHSNSNKGKGKKGKKATRKQEAPEDDEKISTARKLVVSYNNDQRSKVNRTVKVKDIRPHIVCVVVKGLDLSDPSVFKKFIALQTKLHEQVCEHRKIATIATHNIASVNMPLSYDAKPPSELSIRPLGKSDLQTGEQLMRTLHEECQREKQKKKRQVKTGLYKYLDLLDGHELYPCVIDDSGTVISFPPITNSSDTKISETIGDVLIEVTSSVSLPKCKMVMESLIQEMFNGNFESKDLRSEEMTTCNGLILEQVRIVDEEGTLLNVFPSKIDLNFGDSVLVVRE